MVMLVYQRVNLTNPHEHPHEIASHFGTWDLASSTHRVRAWPQAKHPPDATARRWLHSRALRRHSGDVALWNPTLW